MFRVSEDELLRVEDFAALKPPPCLLDAQKTATEQSGHFCSPTQDQLDRLKWDDWVEVCLEGEFIWCQVEAVSGGVLEVSAYYRDDVTGNNEGDCGWFCMEKRHVFRIMTNEEWLELTKSE